MSNPAVNLLACFLIYIYGAEDTNERVAWFSITSLGVCIASALWQLWYLKKFFTKKKLL